MLRIGRFSVQAPECPRKGFSHSISYRLCPKVCRGTKLGGGGGGGGMYLIFFLDILIVHNHYFHRICVFAQSIAKKKLFKNLSNLLKMTSSKLIFSADLASITYFHIQLKREISKLTC